MRIGYYEFKKFRLLKKDLLNEDWEKRENPAQFEKNPKKRLLCKRDQQLKKQNSLRYLYTVRSRQARFSSCPDTTFLSQREQ